jgi:hypothetical protein
MSERTIGYVDWDLNNYHSKVYLKHIREDLSDREFRIGGCFVLEAEKGEQWADDNDVPFCESIGELNERCDYFMVLAPSNPELHLELCEMVFPFGKPTYVDKTFAPDIKTAERLFALADEHGVPMQTSSALRYTNVQDRIADLKGENLRHMVTWGGGRSFGEYAIHPVELAVSCLGSEAQSLMRRGTGAESQLLIDFSGGRTAVVNVYTGAQTPFAASITTTEQTQVIEVEVAEIFLNTLRAVLGLFETGKPSVPRAETLTVCRVLDAARRPEAQAGFIPLTEAG